VSRAAGRRLVQARAPLAARVEVPASKSLTNRALLAAAVADGATIDRPLDCEDTRLLAEALDAAGWPVAWGERLEVGPRAGVPHGPIHLHLGNSGTGARLMIALCAAVPGTFVIDGTARLRERPMLPLLDALQLLGADAQSNDGGLPVRIHGRTLAGGRVTLPPTVSSQFATALLLIAPLFRAGLDLELEGRVPSRPYLDLTEDVLATFGVAVEHDPRGRRWRIRRGRPRPAHVTVEGDWSAAAFFFAAAALAGGRVEIAGLSSTSRQGDRRVVEVMERAGLAVTWGADAVTAGGPVTGPVSADLGDAPDLFPALAAVAAGGPPSSRLDGLEHLKHKESDRLSVMVSNLTGLGAEVEHDHGSLVFTTRLRHSGSSRRVTAAADHRIAMAMAAVALVAGPLELDDPSSVQKSFPGFWDQWAVLVA
jgi:3-phosphoshikimate 1-carboxyvinyltransferase